MSRIYRRKSIWIKLCGLTRREDIEFAIKLKVNALGFILTESPRQISLDKARYLTEGLPPFISRVAVVSNPDAKELEKIITSRLFDYIQFHGDHDPDLIKELPLKTIKAISIAAEEDQERLKGLNRYLERHMERYKEVDYFLFDTKIGQKRGGTGKAFDWDLLDKLKLDKPFILAGGLGPNNIVAALEKSQAVAVDLNSRVEDLPGVKNHQLLLETVEKINNFKLRRE